MLENEDLIDVSDLLKKRFVNFHGKTYVSKKVHEQIIESTQNKYAVLESPEQRLSELVIPMNIGESVDIHDHHPAHNLRHFTYRLHTLDGDRFFKVKCELNYFEGDGVLLVKMEDEE